MNNRKHRLYTGALVILFLLTGMCCPALSPGFNARALAGENAASDLLVESVVLAPEQPAIGNIVKFTVTVKNGGESQSFTSRLACFVDDNLLDSAWITGIAPGGTVLHSFTWKAGAGSHVVRAVIDYDNSVAETDENNNDKTYAFSVLGPDLVVAAISWLPENASSCEKVTLAVTVKNQGSKAATGSSVNLKIDGSSRGNRDISGLEVGANATVTYTWLALAGPHTLEASADRLSQVKETDENNNSKTVTYNTAAPDLVIDSITWSPQNRSESSNVTMSVKISNRGSGKAGGFWVAYYVDDVLQTEDFTEGLKSGGSTLKKYSWIAGASSHTFKAIADPRGEIFENDKANNTLSVTLPEILPDLVIQSITRAAEKSVLTDGVIIIVAVKNQGLNFSGSGELILYIDETYEQREEVPLLLAGETVKILFNCFAGTGTMALKAEVDTDNQIMETNEANNIKTVNISPPKNAPDTDLTIESIAWTPAGPSAGDAVTITASIKNKGPGYAGYSHVDYYVDDAFLDSVYADRIEAGETIVNTVTWQAEAGTHTIKAIADCDNTVAETNEANNEKTVTISVPAPDLIIQRVTWEPEVPQAGDEVDLSITVKNQGDRTAGSSFINYYVDGTYQGGHYVEELAPGAAVTRTFTWRAQKDSWIFYAVIDESNGVKESNDSNNVRTVALPAPDLIVESISWVPENPSENATVTFDIAVENRGAGTADSPHVDFYANDIFMASVRFDEIQAGGTAAGACTWTAQSGNYTFKAIIDGEDIITENDEVNNEKSVTISIEQAEDTSQEITPSSVPESLETVTANDTDITTLFFDDVSGNADIAAEIADTSTAAQPWWQKIVTNKLVIIGVGVVGAGALVILMLLRRRSRRK